ncbi:MAG: acyltransferase [Mesorhizobium sp.]|nr:acyltransferase [Mesorhizobium sp.]MBL8579859.1 acyltransferase [Mesorhizobium sp.]
MLSDHLDADKNSFNLVRLWAALSVLLSHAYPLVLGAGTSEPLGTFTPYTLGQHAVNVFFVISGLMLARSLARNPSIKEFAWARILRIFPGLLAFGVVFSFVFAPILTDWSLKTYFADSHTYLYPLSVLFQFQAAIPPHGVFQSTPYGPFVNEPLWTIRYELIAYFGLASIFATGLLRKRRDALIFLAAALLFFLALEILSPHRPEEHTSIHQLARYGLCFMIGVVAFHLRSSIPVTPVLLPATVALVFLARQTVFEAPAYFLLVAHISFVLAARDFGALTRWTRRNDISYGTYIYGWPTQQAFIALAPGLSVLGLATLSIVTVPIAGWISWRLIERPALRLKLARRAPPDMLPQSSDR